MHKLLFVALVLAAKYFDDFHYSNKAYASIGGVKLQELNDLELDFLQSLRWKMNVRPAELTQCMWILRSSSFGASPASSCSKGVPTQEDSTCQGSIIRSMGDSDTIEQLEAPSPGNTKRGLGQRLASCLRSRRLVQCKPDAQLLF